jgi:hypothetical protein
MERWNTLPSFLKRGWGRLWDADERRFSGLKNIIKKKDDSHRAHRAHRERNK